MILFPVLANAQEIQEIAIDPESETADPINASLVWGIDGGSPAQVNIAEGGTYSVPLHISGPAYIQYPDSEDVPAVMGNLYHIDPEDGEREFVATISVPHDNPDVEFAWQAAGDYEFDFILPVPILEQARSKTMRLLAWILSADIADAQTFEEELQIFVVGQMRFTIQDASACREACYSNVLFLPGIEASRLYTDNEKVWEPSGDDTVQALFLNADGTSVRSDVHTKTGDVIDELPVLGQNIYKSFITKMDELESQELIN